MKGYVMKKLLALILTFVCTLSLFAAEPEFMQNAIKKAKAENKTVMVVFSGMEWCGPCKAFSRDVLKKDTFKTFAKKDLILIDIDTKTDGSVSVTVDGSEVKSTPKESAELSKKYEVEGVPTIILLDGRGVKIGMHVGSGISAQKFIKFVKDSRK